MLLKSSTHSDTGECSKRPRAYCSLAACRRWAVSRSVTSSMATRTRSQLSSWPGRIVPGQLDIDAASGQAVVDQVAAEFGPAFPELAEFVDIGGEHLVAQHLVEIGDQFVEVRRLEQRQGLAVDLEDADLRGAGLDPLRIVLEMVPERR